MERNSSWQHNLKRERQLRGWSQEDVAARIGGDPKTVGRWERGLTFPSPYFQQRLVDLFGKDAEALGFIAEQGEDLRHASTDSCDLHSNWDSPEELHIDNGGEGLVTVAWPPNLPDEPYYLLPDRERDLHNLLAVLQDPKGALVITIDGLGGLGKTALAVELTRRALHQGLFKGITGDSAKQELFAGGEIVKVNEATLDFDALLDTIARQRGRWELTTLPREEKRAMVAQLLRRQRYLILVDNLETTENADALIAHLRTLLGVSRAIITSRKQVRHDFVQAHALKELTREDALFFLRKDLEQRRVEQLIQASEEKIVEVYRVTGGAPLALKLVVAQARFLDLDIILRRLSNAGSKLYSFIYRQSWEQL